MNQLKNLKDGDKMYQKIIFKQTREQKIFFTSDTHFCHDRDFILNPRGYKGIEDHDNKLIEKWNAKVSSRDTIIHCGDFLLGAGQKSKEKFFEIVNKLNGNIIYLWGNHNAGASSVYKELINTKYGDVEEVYPYSFETKRGSFTYRGHQILLKVEDFTQTNKIVYWFFCSHFAHRLWIDSHKGHVNHVSGHSHGSDKESQPESKYPKRLDVGIENFGEPISLEYIVDIFNKKKMVKLDHHERGTLPSF